MSILTSCILAIMCAALATAGQAGTDTSPPDPASTPRILLLPDPTATSPSASVFTEYVHAVRQALESGEAGPARKLAERAVQVFGGFRRPWLHLAASRLLTGEWELAIEAARRAGSATVDEYEPKPNPEESSAGPAYWEGLALYRAGQNTSALQRLRSACEHDPEWAEAARIRGEVAYVTGMLPEARRAYESAFDLDPDLGTARDLSYYADAKARGGDLRGALEILQTALENFPYEPGLHANLGHLLERDDQLAQAYDRFILEVALHGVEGSFAVAALDASQRIVKRASANTDHPDRHVLLMISTALASLETGKRHDAIHEIEHAARLGEGMIVPRIILADALIRQGRAHEARQVLDEFLVERPDFVPALHSLAEAQRLLGEPALAKSTRDRIRFLFPDFWKLRLPVEEGP